MKRAGLSALLIVIIVVLVGVIGYTAYNKKMNGGAMGAVIKDSGTDISDYSAVFLTNGQVYFGKLTNNTDKYDLRDIYYLQVNQQIQPDQKNGTTGTTPTQTNNGTAASGQQPNVVLVKLGDELHGPNDRMLINPAQVVFTESLKNSSKVVDAINKNAAAKK